MRGQGGLEGEIKNKKGGIVSEKREEMINEVK